MSATLMAVLPRALAYHKIASFELGGTWMPRRRFVAQIDSLRRAGYRFIDETAFLESLAGRRRASPREILLTFDDGYRNLLDAVPALEERGVPVLVFLVSAYAGRRNRWELGLPGRGAVHLSWEECTSLARSGFSFGSHTRTHRDLTRIPIEEARDEIRRSRAEIEDRLGSPVRSLSYPFGRLDGALRSEAEAAGYRAAFTLYPRRVPGAGGAFELRRDPVYVIDTAGCVRRKIGDGAWSAIEESKGRTINAAAVLTPLTKGVLARANSVFRRARGDR
ncbi:MAG: polysaccharide deacetylase family protein [Candidatus Latescibacterota bacterium]|nr:MAG: polysaccharide deacetylase family protein [Candidatus Latescibacterota bacterium]